EASQSCSFAQLASLWSSAIGALIAQHTEFSFASGVERPTTRLRITLPSDNTRCEAKFSVLSDQSTDGRRPQ
ncbi:MAG: hypothetical protein AAFV54_14635, partial [Pseudomonadota bacterium]